MDDTKKSTGCWEQTDAIAENCFGNYSMGLLAGQVVLRVKDVNGTGNVEWPNACFQISSDFAEYIVYDGTEGTLDDISITEHLTAYFKEGELNANFFCQVLKKLNKLENERRRRSEVR